VASVEDTGAIRRLVVEEIRQMKHDPRRPGAIDVMLLSVSIGSGVVVGVCLLILTVASDHYPVDPGRVFLTMGAAGFCVAPVLAGLYGVNRATRKRFTRLTELLDRNRCDCDGGADIDRATKEAYDIGRQVERRQRTGG
jgi:hypothetical protein